MSYLLAMWKFCEFSLRKILIIETDLISSNHTNTGERNNFENEIDS